MASVKRKAVADERPSKKAKSTDAKDEKKPKEAREKKGRKPQEDEAGEKRPTANSILQQEDRAFPRGGGSVLTPLEHKQIKAQAERDVLLEQEQEDGETAEGGKDEPELFKEGPAAGKKKKRKDGKKGFGDIKVEGSGVKIQGLSYKSLVVGSTVLGRVTAITGRDVALALPNNLTGYAPIVAVSDSLTKRIQKLLEEDGNDEDDEDVDLKKLFFIGQWVRGIVTSTGTDPTEKGAKSKRHIELSLDPGHVNGGLSEDNFVPNSTIQASVRSVEDHGIIMDLGLPDASVRGFISKKDLGTAYNLTQLEEGQVMLCLVTGKGSNGKVLKLCPDPNKFSVTIPGNVKLPIVNEAPTVDAFQPGTAVEILVTESGSRGVVGKIMGMLDVTADVIHSEAFDEEDMVKKYKIGSKTKARIIYALPQDDGVRRVGISILDHALTLIPPPAKLAENSTAKIKTQSTELDQPLALSATVEDAKVTRVSADRGIYLTLPGKSLKDQSFVAFAHISQISDNRIDSISASGPYKVDSIHKARIISYNPIDNIYYVSLKKSTLEQTFLRLEDLTVGEMVKGTVSKLILGGPKGVTGVLVKLSDSITGLVPEMHLSDAHLSHPERKFREGVAIKARILSVDIDKRQVRLTLKKTLVEADGTVSIWSSYTNLKPGMESQGTIINLLSNGAAVQFYGEVRAWLPVAEMSDSFIEAPEKHFRLGQTVNVRIVSVNPETREMKVTCKDSGDFSSEQQDAWDKTIGGAIVTGTVTSKTADSVLLDLNNDLKGVIKIGHLVDGSAAKGESALKRIRVGQSLANLVVLDTLERSQTVVLSNKPGILADAQAGILIKSFEDAQEGRKVHGFIRNITPDAVYVEFASGTVGLLPKSQITSELAAKPEFGLRKDQTLNLWVSGRDNLRQRFLLSMREVGTTTTQAAKTDKPAASQAAGNPTDTSVSTIADFSLGKVTKACVVSVRATQVNVRLADNVQGRIDVSEAFDSWEEITNKGVPLSKFKPGDLIDVKILGIHDARNHRFLPISHRQGKVPVFELSAKKARIESGDESLLSFDTVKEGQTCLAFLNNHAENCVWVNLSPNVRGRVALMDLSDDVGQLQNVENRFRTGCALRVKVKAIDVAAGRLDLSARQTEASSGPLKLKDLTPGMVLPARVTKVSERSVLVEISDNLAGPVPLVELSDDYDQANTSQYNKNDIVRVCVLGVDLPNKRAFLSLRPSKVLSSSLPVKDTQITDVSQLKAGDIVRGFVKQVADKGVFVALGARADALVRISDLSDQYIKDWQSIFEIDQLVKGRVLSVDTVSKQVQLSLKKSHVDKNYTPPLSINDLKAGMIVTGKVRKVEDFGAFVDIDNTVPRLSGLCHRSEVAAKRVEDVRTLYSAGDAVKAKVLDVNVEKRKISLGLKASYFTNTEEEGEDSDVDMEDGGADVDAEESDEESDADGGVDLENVQDMEDSEEDDVDAMDVDLEPVSKRGGGLKAGGFDWTGDSLNNNDNGAVSESEHEGTSSKKRKHKKPEIKVDMTGSLDEDGPKSVSDFERQLLGQPNNSDLWIRYMSFQVQLGEIQKARDIAERALRTIHIREGEEKLNIWLAWLRLEVNYSDDDQVDEVFKQACQVQDTLEIHEKMASIYIDHGKKDKAEGVFEKMVANKAFRASPDVWMNYATFLMRTMEAPDKARALLAKALQSVASREHRQLTANFAGLEFRSDNGAAERGRTIFESLTDTWPKWTSGWDMWLNIEKSRIASAQGDEAKKDAIEKTRVLFGRIAAQSMKKRRAKMIFKQWLEFEEQEGTEKHIATVKQAAQEYVEKLQARGDEDL